MSISSPIPLPCWHGAAVTQELPVYEVCAVRAAVGVAAVLFGPVVQAATSESLPHP